MLFLHRIHFELIGKLVRKVTAQDWIACYEGTIKNRK